MSALAAVPVAAFREIVVVGAIAFSLIAIAVLTRDEDGGVAVRTRLLHGVPWGTAITILFVLSVYLIVQGGHSHLRRPVVVPFRAWSYSYPLGMATAPFSHASFSHLLGNLVATVAYASLAEYAWGHYPRDRGVGTFTSLRTNPYARILAVPAAAIVVGAFTSLFTLGPVIGFSGVVFAFAGFALVHRPILAALAILASRVLDLVITAVLYPRAATSPRPRVVTPWWADVAIQGHAVGLFAGILIAVALAWTREAWPDPRRLWFGLVAFAAFQGLWALYLPADSGRYVLYRWAGVAVVFVLAVVVVVGVAGPRIPALPAVDAPTGTLAIGVAPRRFAFGFLVTLLVALSVPAVFYNVAPVGQADGPEPSVQVRDYAVGYDEDVPDRYVGAVTVPFVGYSPDVNASGVIVTSERRQVWQQAVHPAALKNRGHASVLLGGVGWRQRVAVDLTGWSVTGGEDVYQVSLGTEGTDRTLAYATDPSTTDTVIEGRNVTLRPDSDGFTLAVTRGGESLGTAPVPGNGTVTTAGGLTFTRLEGIVYASANLTRAPIAERMEGS